MTGIINGIPLSAPFWALISWLLDGLDLPGSNISMAFAYVCAGIGLLIAALWLAHMTEAR